MATYAYVGCYTTSDRHGRGKGIEVYEMDPRSGAWTHVQTLETIGNPSWQTVGPDGQHLYSVHGGDGFTQVSAYRIDRSSGKRRWEAEVAEARAPRPGALTQSQVVAAVNDAAGSGGVVVSAAGSLPGDLHKLWRSQHPRQYHVEYGYSCMGYEVAGGLGVKLADPEAEVYVMVGDGSYLMMAQEIVTAVAEGLPFIPGAFTRTPS